MNPRRTITTAFTLLFAAAVFVGGPAAIHYLGDHLAATPEVSCCNVEQQSPVLPAEQDTPEEDCPECDLLSSLAFADTGTNAELITATTRTVRITPTTATPATAAAYAPRATRGPPAA